MNDRGAITNPEAITLERARKVAAEEFQRFEAIVDAQDTRFPISERYWPGNPVARQAYLWSYALSFEGDLSTAAGHLAVVKAWPIFYAEMVREKARRENNTVVPTEVFEQTYHYLKERLIPCYRNPMFPDANCTTFFGWAVAGPAAFALWTAKFASGAAKEALLGVVRARCGRFFDPAAPLARLFGGPRCKGWACAVFQWLNDFCQSERLPDEKSLRALAPEASAFVGGSVLVPSSAPSPSPLSPLPDTAGKVKGFIALGIGAVGLYFGLKKLKVI